MIQKIDESKSWFFGKINNIDNLFNQTYQEKRREDPNK